MTLHKDFLALSKAARPGILKLARRRKLIDRCFKEFQREVYPGAPQDQVHELRVAFFAGAAELHAVQLYGAETGSIEPTDEDMELMSGIAEEIEQFHKRTIDATSADRANMQ